MYVACPSCKALYTISADQLRLADGRVRCGQCRTTFSATHAVFADPREALAFEYPLEDQLLREIDDLVDRALDQVPGAEEPPPQTGGTDGATGHGMRGDDARSAAQPPMHADDTYPEAERHLPAGDVSSAAEQTHGDDAIRTAGQRLHKDEESGPAGPGARSTDIDSDTDAPTHTPGALVEPVGLRLDMDCYAQPVAAEFVSDEEPHGQLYELSQSLLFDDGPVRHGRTSWGTIAAALLLTLALAAQFAWWDRNRLAQVAALRPALDWLCKPVTCNLPLRHDLARVEMVEREVRDHPRVQDALLVSAAFINRAPYAQVYPVLQISFSDVSGTPIAVRRFMPEEYLHDRNPARGMAPGEQTLVMLEVLDPGERAVSFQFDFL